LRSRSNPKARALEVCLQGIQAGISPEQVLQAYPRWADELRPLVWTAISARSHAAGLKAAAEEAQENSLAGFLKVSQRMLPRKERPWLGSLLRLIINILGLVVIVAGSALAAERVSRQALPGSVLYPFKLASRSIRLTLTKDPASRLALELTYDQESLADIHTLIERSLTAEVELVDGLSQIDGNTWQVGQIRVQIPPSAQVLGDIQPGFFISVQGKLQIDGSLLAERLKMREYTLSGKIQAITQDELVLAGAHILLTPETIILGIPLPDNQAHVIIRRSLDGQFYARLVEIPNVGEARP
jgi:hypothetical protein